ncbi:MAG: LysR family transcriptional regulator [Burkholderiaceae bacterium]
MSKSLNFNHLLYFWVVAKEGSISRASERLGIASQTISGQIKLLEKFLGSSLFAPKGRGLTLTEPGRIALGYADQIFLLGEQLVEAVADPALGGVIRLHIGTTDALPKWVSYELIEPVFVQRTAVRLQCHEGEFEELLAELALHKLDVVLADRPVGDSSGLRVFSHPIGDGEMAVFGTAELAERFRNGFPQSLNSAPLLLPSRHTAVRARLDGWLQHRELRPHVVGEFEDSALLATFGATGLGLFPAVAVSERDLAKQYGVQRVGPLTGVREQVFAITNERRIKHPLIETLLSHGRRLWQRHDQQEAAPAGLGEEP